jgi:hypothetical protein
MLLESAQSKHVLPNNEVCHSDTKEVMTNGWELVINNNNNNKKDQSNQQGVKTTKIKIKSNELQPHRMSQ